MIKKGGMESGLKKAETNAHEAKLFKISGGMRPVMQEVIRSSLGQMIQSPKDIARSVPKDIKVFLQVDMAWSSMNHGDVFVLDSGKRISFSFFSRKIYCCFHFDIFVSRQEDLCVEGLWSLWAGEDDGGAYRGQVSLFQPW